TNQTFESLDLTLDGAALFTATEGTLAPDGFATPVRARLRLLRYGTPPGFTPAAQYFYLAEPAQGLAEIAALGADELLALERGFIPGLGNT
ncbi:esterase-like activity of phytase family protein, partial [Streptomyces niveiscabiei]|uniref:esterase-like activity of phytase family protein n=1 Tax=Streptomyces niveiscabiei TaxID=164115 RepID=UPI0038F664B3